MGEPATIEIPRQALPIATANRAGEAAEPVSTHIPEAQDLGLVFTELPSRRWYLESRSRERLSGGTPKQVL
jgi:hypothetical protein